MAPRSRSGLVTVVADVWLLQDKFSARPSCMSHRAGGRSMLELRQRASGNSVARLLAGGAGVFFVTC